MKFKIDPKNREKQFEKFVERAKERIKEAKILFQEKHYGGAISRAYYGFFEAAHAALITKGISAKTHAGVIALFSLHFVKTDQIPAKFIRFFKQAKEAREEADYAFLKDFTKEEAERIIQTAEDFVKEIENKFKTKVKLDSN